jgi:hypothetical protein
LPPSSYGREATDTDKAGQNTYDVSRRMVSIKEREAYFYRPSNKYWNHENNVRNRNLPLSESQDINHLLSSSFCRVSTFSILDRYQRSDFQIVITLFSLLSNSNDDSMDLQWALLLCMQCMIGANWNILSNTVNRLYRCRSSLLACPCVAIGKYRIFYISLVLKVQKGLSS